MPYGTEAQLETFLGESLAAALATFTGDGTDDPSVAAVIAQARADADAEIDAALGKRYAVPFAAIDDSTATPAIVQTISHNLTAAELFKKRHAAGVDYETYRAAAEQLMARILAGTYDIPGAAEVDGDDAAAGLATGHSNITGRTLAPTFAGLNADGSDRMKDW